MSYLSEENTKKSSQRLNLLSMTFGVLYLIFIVGIYIVTKGFKCNTIDQAEWIGMGIFLSGLLLFLGVNAGVKAYQKKFEKTKTE